MQYAALKGSADSVSAEEHLRQLDQLAAQADAAGDAEIVTAIRGHRQIVLNCPGHGRGSVTFQRRDGSMVPLSNIGPHLRRSVAARPAHRSGSNVGADHFAVEMALLAFDTVIANDKARGRAGASMTKDLRAINRLVKAK